MKKRLLSALLICCMVLTMLPVTVYAASPDPFKEVKSVPIANTQYATVDDLESSFSLNSDGTAAVLTLGHNTNKDTALKWYVLGKDASVAGRNTALFAATGPYGKDTDVGYDNYRIPFHKSNSTAYDASWGSVYTDGKAAPEEVDITYYAGSQPHLTLRERIHDWFYDQEYALLNETTYRNQDLRNNRSYTLTDKLYLPVFGTIDQTTGSHPLYVGSNNQFRMDILPRDNKTLNTHEFWTRAAYDDKQVVAYNFSGWNFNLKPRNTFIMYEGTPSQIDGHESGLLPATNLDLGNVLFASTIPVQTPPGYLMQTRNGHVDDTDVNTPMTLRLDAAKYGEELGEIYINENGDDGKPTIYVRRDPDGPEYTWLIVQYSSEYYLTDLPAGDGYWCRSLNEVDSKVDEYGFVHITLDDIELYDSSRKLTSLDNCKIWLEVASAYQSGYTFAVEPKPLPEKTVTIKTKTFSTSGLEHRVDLDYSITKTFKVPAGGSFTYYHKGGDENGGNYDSYTIDKDKEIVFESSYGRFHIDNIWEDLTIVLTYEHWNCSGYWETTPKTPATCTENGLSEKISCRICGRVKQEQTVLPALGHDLETTTTATCTEPGTTTTACQREGCGYSETEATAALGHDWGEPETISATCTTPGEVKYTCKRDTSHTKIETHDALGHDWEEDFTVDVQPTCKTAGSKSRHCTRCDEKTDVTEIPAPGHDSSWICSLDVTVEAPKCGTVVEKRKTYSPEPPPVVTTPEDAPYWLRRSQNPNSADTSWCTVTDGIFTGTIIGGQTYCAEFSLEPKAGSHFFAPDEEDIRDHLTIHGGALGSLKPHYTWDTKDCDKIEFNVLVTAVHDYDENDVCRGCGVADHEHSFEEVWSTDEGSHWHACAQDGCTATEDFGAHSFGADNATCETCGYVRIITCQHDFGSYLCDKNQHWKECRNPGCSAVTSRGDHTLSRAKRNETEYWWCQTCYSYTTLEHNFADDWNTSGSHHWKQCLVDNGYCKFVSEYAEHDYGGETGTECVTCGYERTFCDHTYSTGFNGSDETSHWRECTNPVCTDRSGSRKDNAAHDLNAYGDCNDCGYRHTEHTYGEWHYDGYEHWKNCTKPGCKALTGKTGHTYNGGICSVCGYDRSITPAHTHFYGEWSRDSREHWRECADPNCSEETGRIINRTAHVYADDADTTCELCGYERSVAPDHSGGHVYGGWSWDVNSHWYECTDADCTDKAGSIKAKAAHVYDNDTDAFCNDCGYARSTELSHTHTFDGWRYDAERHYRICSAQYCPSWGKAMDSAPHVYDDDQDEFCNVCAYGRFGTQHEHTYGDWTADGETGHSRVCTAENCPYADKGRQTEAHSYDDDADMICDICGYDRTVVPPAHEHSYGDWSHDETNHWHECTDADCPDKSSSVKDTAAHVYDDDADATCNICGYERTITPPAHEHSYGDWSKDSANHWHECTDAACPDRADSVKDTAAHVYDDDADADCNVCGYERTITPPAHEHSYGDWSKDSTNHWYECTDPACPDKSGSIKDTAAHIYDDDADATCNVCGYERTITPPAHEHSYGEWSKDSTNHWHECTDAACPDRAGSIKDTAAHVYDDDADADCNVCGYERTITPPAHEHSYGDWSKDSTNHWHECTDPACPDRADSVKDTAAHIYDNDADADCNVCGYERTVTPPAVERQVVVLDSYAPITGAGRYAAGTFVVIDAGSRENYTFTGWISDDVAIDNAGSAITSFFMPDRNVTVKADWVYTGSSGSTTAPAITVPVSSDKETVKVSASVSNGVATVKITDWQLERVVSDTNTVTVDVSGLQNVDSAKLPASIVETVEQFGADLTITLSTGSVTLDAAALAAVGNGKDMIVSVQKVALTDTQRDAVGTLAQVAAVVDVNVTAGMAKLTAFNGGKLTVSIPYTLKAGEDPAKLQVWFIRDDGSIENMGGSYDRKTGCFVFSTEHLSCYLLVSTAGTQRFADVPVSVYYAEAVAWAVKNGITDGTSDMTFDPNGFCTRAQAVTFLWRVAGSPAPKNTAMPFTDVPAGGYYYDAVLWAVESGITVGTTATTFSPDMTCSRSQIVAFLWRSEKSPAAESSSPFTDVAADAYYANAVLWAVKEDITKGTTNTTFSPDADCTRAQIVTFIWRCKK